MRGHRRTFGVALAIVALAMLVVVTDHDVTGVVSADAGRAGSPPAGAKVFASAGCTACHTFTPAKATGKVGPNLDKLALDNAATVLVISNGRNAMPSFKGRLSPTQISDVAAYLLASKAEAAAPSPTPVKGARATLGVRLTDTKLVLSSAVLPPGRVTLHARNVGKLRHSLVVLRVEPSALLVTAFRAVRPGQALSRAIRLRTGSYLISSDRRGRIHGSMLALLRVRIARGAAPAPEPGAGTEAPPPGGGTGGSPSPGAQVFASAGCGGCHTLAAAGASGRVGPNLDVLRPSLNQVVAVVTAGRGAMPAFGGRLSTAQIQDVAAFVSSVAGTPGGGSRGSAPTGPPGLVLFQRGGCGGCHTLAAAGSTGTRGPDLDDEHPDADEVIEVVTRGEDKMPSFATVFSAAEIRELARWLESVTRKD